MSSQPKSSENTIHPLQLTNCALCSTMIYLSNQNVDILLATLTKETCFGLLKMLHGTLQLHSSAKKIPPSERNIHQPQRQLIETRGIATLFMPCAIHDVKAVKVVTVSREGVNGCVNLFEADGKLMGVLDATELTAFRTALVVMIPFTQFPQPIGEIVVFGVGKQAMWHIKLALLLRGDDVTKVTVVARDNPRQIPELFVNLRQEYPWVTFQLIFRRASDSAYLVHGSLQAAGAICCCTPSTEPLFSYDHINDTRHRFISLIGSFTPVMREIDSETLLSGGFIYVDSKEECLAEAGELIHARVKEHQLVEIGDQRAMETTPTGFRNHIFKCVGLAVMDLTISQEILRMAHDQNIGIMD